MSTNWLKRWEEGDIGFHQSTFHPFIEKYGRRFFTGPILVPLCGKSLDMLFLSNLGFDVIGVELSPIACIDFFKENRVSYREKKVGDFRVFESDKITLWCGDFFDLPSNVWQNIRGIYDRASLVALPEEVRVKYARDIKEKTLAGLQMLLITFEYPSDTVQGPPFSIGEKEIQMLYPNFKLLKLEAQQSSVRTTPAQELLFWLENNNCIPE